MAEHTKTRARVDILFHHPETTVTVPDILSRCGFWRQPNIGRASICYLLQYVANRINKFRWRILRYDSASGELYNSADTRRPLSFLLTVNQIVEALENEYYNLLAVQIASHDEDLVGVYTSSSYKFFTHDVKWQRFTFLQIYTRWSTLGASNTWVDALVTSVYFTARFVCVCDQWLWHTKNFKGLFYDNILNL